jgi:hypothetical protein
MRHNDLGSKKGKLALGLGLTAGLLGGMVAGRRMIARRRPAIAFEVGATPGTALITGASSGIGAAFARQLAAQGYRLVLVARREERLAALSAELAQRHGVTAESLPADLSSPEGVERVIQRIGQLEALDLLLNNAGFATSGEFAEIDGARHADMIHVHVMASVLLTRAALPGMLARRRGAIINVSSVAGFLPLPGSVTYSASKAYLKFFSEALHAELDGAGVRIQALCPGFTLTEFHDRPEHGKFDRSRVPAGFWMSADEVAVASLEALARDQAVCIPGLKYRIIAAVVRLIPLWLLKLGYRRSPRRLD